MDPSCITPRAPARHAIEDLFRNPFVGAQRYTTKTMAARLPRMRRTLVLVLALVLSVPLAANRQPVRARHGMVVAMESLAVDVGVDVLKQGGNAVDAAVAVGFAMAVTHPFAGNLGGGGYMLIRLADGTSTFIDFRERAPEKATRNMYL